MEGEGVAEWGKGVEMADGQRFVNERQF